MITQTLDGLDGSQCDICVVGAGPVGISLALELSRLGRSVLLLESGGSRVSPKAQSLADADIANPAHHVAMDIAVQRRLGGASNLWGGRCVAMEALDFQPRSAIPESGWPIGPSDVEPYLRAACDYVGSGEPVFRDPIPGLTVANTDFEFDRLERWSDRPRLGAAHLRRLREDRAIDLRLNATVVGLRFAGDGRVSQVLVSDPDGKRITFAPRCLVLAAGGLESTRLLLAAQREQPSRFGGEDGPLGRYYMGHLYGSVADMVIHSAPLDAGMDYYLSPDRRYIRRRFTPSAALQERKGLSNVALWPDYPPLYDPRHGNGILSLAVLALSVPPIGRMLLVESIRQHYVGPGKLKRLPHIANILRDLIPTAVFVPRFLYHHYLARPRKPGFFQLNAGRRYAVRFHAEHLPDPDSRVRLAHSVDALGVPRLAIDLRYTEADTAPLIRAHECFEEWLNSTGLGTLTWTVPPAERSDYIIKQCYDGHHQIGTTRMAATPRDGVVGPDCRVFGAANLFIAGSSVFPTSGAANPTMTAVALGVRLAALIAAEAGAMTKPPSPGVTRERGSIVAS
jgi:choline dehydrogenase-like flavoprotein